MTRTATGAGAFAFRKGDRVQYQGDGPVMHVITISGDLCYCNWVDDFGRLHQATFEQRNLTQPDGEPSP